MIFDDWGGLVRVVVVGLCVYISLLALLRVSGSVLIKEPESLEHVGSGEPAGPGT